VRGVNRKLSFAVGIVLWLAACQGDDPVLTESATPSADAAGGEASPGVDSGGGTDGPATPNDSIWVDATKGSDENDGLAESRPVKTLKVALALVVPGGTVNLAAGVYSAATGDTFNVAVPPNVTITTLQRGAAILKGTKSQTGLRVTKGARLVNLKLVDFREAITADAGNLELTGVDFETSQTMILLGPSQTMERTLDIKDCTFSKGDSVAFNTNEWIVKVAGSTFSNLQGMYALAALGTTGTLEITNSIFENNAITDTIIATGLGGTATVTDTKIRNNATCGKITVVFAPAKTTFGTSEITGNNCPLQVGGGELVLLSTKVTSNGARGVVVGAAGKLKSRFSTFSGHTAANIEATANGTVVPPLDLGATENPGSDPGGNMFTAPSAGHSIVYLGSNTAGGNVISSLRGNSWGLSPPAANVVGTGNQQTLASHYRVTGYGFTLNFVP
jgi:hypothetical protein